MLRQRFPKHFNPRPPRGGRLRQRTDPSAQPLFQSTPPARGATITDILQNSSHNISIHAPREGGDVQTVTNFRVIVDFNPRPPRGGRRLCIGFRVLHANAFQSTPPARGATMGIRCIVPMIRIFQSTPPARGATGKAFTSEILESPNFNPRPPRGGRRQDNDGLDGLSDISIHAPREGGDDSSHHKFKLREKFQSTPPARGATYMPFWMIAIRRISIHAPREGGDESPKVGYFFHPYFNPRPPRGGRL